MIAVVICRRNRLDDGGVRQIGPVDHRSPVGTRQRDPLCPLSDFLPGLPFLQHCSPLHYRQLHLDLPPPNNPIQPRSRQASFIPKSASASFTWFGLI
jgi:hypothetical protein